MAGAATRHDTDFALDGRVFVLENTRILGCGYQVGMAFDETLKHVFDDHIGVIDNALHDYPP